MEEKEKELSTDPSVNTEDKVNRHLELINANIKKKALPGAMWLVLVIEGREPIRPLTFIFKNNQYGSSSGIYRSLFQVESLDFVFDISKINQRRCVEQFANFTSKLLATEKNFVWGPNL